MTTRLRDYGFYDQAKEPYKKFAKILNQYFMPNKFLPTAPSSSGRDLDGLTPQNSCKTKERNIQT